MTKEIVIKKLAEIIFDLWKESRIEEGYHLPEKCPKFEKNSDNEEILKNADLIHCSKCDFNLSDFNFLDNYKKEEYFNKAEKLYSKIIESGLKFK